VPASKTSIIKQIVVTNVTGSAATFSLYIGSAATPNALFNATSVAANDTIIINLSQVLNQLETLTALASTNLALNITISGVENDGPLNPLSVYIADQAITTNKIADGSVTSAKITNETIVNADINASAAIAQSKVANLTSDLALKAPIASPTFTGTVLKSNQPIISGQMGSSASQSADSLVLFDDFWVARGITYNSSTRRFTVPVSGIYRITFNPFFETGHAAGRVLVGVNTDSPTASNHRGHAYRESATYDTGCIDSVVEINSGGYIVFRILAGRLYNQTSDRFNQFSIELIG
jgi:hypothetical protein